MNLEISNVARKRLIVLLLIVFVANIGYSFFYRIEPIVDAGAYDRIGWNVAQGIGYVEDASNSATPEKDNAIGRVGPGYQFFLAGLYSVFGHSVSLVWFVHAVFRVLTTFLVALIALRLFKGYEHSEKIALFAGFLFGLSPDLIVIQAMLLTETLGLFLLVFSVWLILMMTEHDNMWLVLATGLALTVAIMTRPTTLFIFLIVVGVLVFKKRWVPAILMFVFPLLIMTPWAVRNYRIYDHFVPTSSTGGYDLWVGNNQGAIGGFDKTPEIKEAREQLHITELDKLGFQKYFSFIGERPLKFIELQFRKTTMYFSLIRPTGFWSYLKDKPVDQLATLGASGVWTAVLFVGGISGAIWMFLRRKDLQTRLFLAFAVLQPLAVIPLIVESRYRYPLFPFLAVFAALFLVELLRNKKEEDRRLLGRIGLYTLLVLIGATGADALYNTEDILSRLNRLLG